MIRKNFLYQHLVPSFLLPVPNSSLYAQLNSLQLSVDPASVLWINLFSRGLLQTLDQVKAFYHLQDSSKAEEHVDIRMDAAQLKVNRQLFYTICWWFIFLDLKYW